MLGYVVTWDSLLRILKINRFGVAGHWSACAEFVRVGGAVQGFMKISSKTRLSSKSALSTTRPDSQASRPRRQISRGRKLCFALIPVLALVVLAEFLLMLLGVAPLSSTADPFVGFSNSTPLFSPLPTAPDSSGDDLLSRLEAMQDGAPAVSTDAKPAEEWLATTPSKLVWFNDQSFPRVKRPGTKRIFCLGGSTTFGRPYSDTTSFCGWLREVLNRIDPHTRWEVINAGGVSYASYRVAAIMEELSQYDPDWFIVYSVHNEFLERRTYADLLNRPGWLLTLQSFAAQTRSYSVLDRLYQAARRSADHLPVATQNQLPPEVDERLNHTVGPVDYHRDASWRSGVLRHYEFNLQRMVDIARRCNSQILFITPASNEGSCTPFKSEFSSLQSESQQRILSRVQQGVAALDDADYAAAATLLEEAVELDPAYAETRYRLGQAYVALERFDEAGREFSLAIEEDICPLRAVEEIDSALRRVVAEATQEPRDVWLVDFNEKLHALSEREQGNRILGDRYFLDHVHPTLEIHRQLAVWILEELKVAENGVGAEAWIPVEETVLSESEASIFSRVDLRSHGVALRNLAKVLHWSGKFVEAAPRASDALELLPNDPESRFVLADCLTHMGEIDAALVQYELLFEDYPEWGRGYVYYGALLSRVEEYEKAKGYLMLAVLHKPEDAYVLFELGRVHLALEEWAFAEESLRKADQLYPDDPATLELLATAREKLNRNPSPLR
ncbi:Tetratricopeptide repeat protein [Aureliella helgolandensis]|uniref:Tetratricopeptide repeat protein n=2 Tax=Aureliella helgolandensis TaxID=2527968 RepID=A0A518GH09_9BACT|nr:Tetratricopeptide repeat protein [Aureliella helgolandensis]